VRLGIVLLVIGLAGTVLFFMAAADVGNWSLYQNSPWPFVGGLVFFIVFLVGLHFFRKAMRKIGEERHRRW
jgi:membrane protein implicated in regulation of membrane protease activity